MDTLIDLDALTAPVEGAAAPAGEDLRLAVDASDFFALKDLRAEARSAEREAAQSPDGETPVIQAGHREWSNLADLAQRLLAARTKDLEIASWLCEALTRLGGFPGLATGLDLMQRLLSLYWYDGLYPSEDEDGVETRIAPVTGLLGLSGAAALLQPIRLLPISDRDDSVALWSLEAATAPIQGSDDAEARERAVARRAERMEQVRAAVARSSPGFLRTNHAAITEALALIEALVAGSDQVAQTGRFGSQVTEPLRTILRYFEEQAGALFAPEAAGDGFEEADSAQEGDASGAGVAAAAGPAGVGRITSRDDAYDSVLRIAEYLERSEPQSLSARGLREVVRRARLPLDELLLELIPEEENRRLFLLRAGVKFDPPAQEVSSGW